MDNSSNKIKTVCISIGIILLYFIWPIFTNNIISMLKIEGNIKLLLMFLLNFLCLFLIASVYIDDLKKDFKKFIKNIKTYMIKGLKYFLFGLGAYFIINILIACIFKFSNISNDNLSNLENVFKDNTILLVLSTTLYYPIIEELVFKKTFKDIIDNKWLFTFISAFSNAFFAYAFSITNVLTLVYIIPCTAFYMGLSYSYYKTNNVFVPIVYRIIYNLIPSIFLMVETLLLINWHLCQ